MSADTGLDNVEELTDRPGPALLGQEQPQPGRPGTEIGESLPRDHVPGVQRHPVESGERQVPRPEADTGPAMSQSMNPAKCPARHTAL